MWGNINPSPVLVAFLKVSTTITLSVWVVYNHLFILSVVGSDFNAHNSYEHGQNGLINLYLKVNSI